MLPLGTPCPDFALADAVSGREISTSELVDKPGLLVMFICNHCPYVVHVRDELGRLGRDYLPKGVAIVAINSNDVARYPQDGPPEMAKLARQLRWEFPFLFDATQKVARAFDASCTPEFYLFDASRKLVYRGQLDDSRPNGRVPVTGRDVRAAIDALLAGKPISPDQTPAVGCGIKWRR